VPHARSTHRHASNATPYEASYVAGLRPLLKVNDVTTLARISRRELDRMRSAGAFPAPDVWIGVRSPRWKAETFEAWVAKGGAR
jgi:predicted DNA-binding transcriptional regulator AlpA